MGLRGAVRGHFSSICPSPGARKGGFAPGDCFWGLPGANQVAGAPGSGVPVMGTLTRARKPCCRAWLLCGDLGVEAGRIFFDTALAIQEIVVTFAIELL